MGWVLNNVLSNLIIIALLSLLNNSCFVAIAKIRKWREDKRDNLKNLESEIQELKEQNQKLLQESSVQIEMLNADNETLKERIESMTTFFPSISLSSLSRLYNNHKITND